MNDARWAGPAARRRVGFALAGCHGDPPPASGPSPLAHRNVMVIDEGIDLTSPDLQGSVAMAFTAVCDAGAPNDAGATNDAGQTGGYDAGVDAGTDDEAPSFDDLKRNYIMGLGVADQSCALQPGISAKDDPLPSIDRFCARWNGMVRSQEFRDQVFSPDEWNEITSVMAPALAAFPFHGTSTSSTAAHDNPGVRLVVIERRLQDPTTMTTDFVCYSQAELDQTVALLSDPDVRDAYIHAPNSRYTDQFFDVVHQFDVGLVNTWISSRCSPLSARFARRGVDRRSRARPTAFVH